MSVNTKYGEQSRDSSFGINRNDSKRCPNYVIRACGFTLMEVLVTLSIITVLVSLSAPAISSMIQSHALKSAAEDVFYSLHFARSIAVASNKRIGVTIYSGDKWCVGLSESVSCNCFEPGTCSVAGLEYRVQNDNNSTVSMPSVNFGAETHTYFEPVKGLSAGHAGHIIFSNVAGALKLIVSNVGRLRICCLKGQIGNYPPC